MLVDHDILIDAGTGASELSIVELALIDHVFITCSHLDHIACLPFIIDTVGAMRNKPLTMYATRATQELIRTHIFNWMIWPDFSQFPSPSNPYLRFQTIEVGERIDIKGRKITALPAVHTVPRVGYHLDSGISSLVFTGDTTVNDDIWIEINKIANLRYLIIEVAFSEREQPLAVMSKHLCPSLLHDELLNMDGNPEVFITRLKPEQADWILADIGESLGDFRVRTLRNNQIFDLYKQFDFSAIGRFGWRELENAVKH
jgi:cAMP phosphodiesterase